MGNKYLSTILSLLLIIFIKFVVVVVVYRTIMMMQYFCPQRLLFQTMTTAISVRRLSTNSCDLSNATILIVMDNKDQYLSLDYESPLCQLGLQLKEEAQLQMLKAVATTLSSSLDFATTVEFFLPAAGAHSVRKIILSLLPTALSRDNCNGKPHAISALLKSAKYSGNLVIILNPATRDIGYAQACAVGRSFPILSLKSTATQAQVAKPTITILVNCSEELDTSFETCVATTIENIRLVQRLVDTPPNILHTDAYVQECFEIYRTLIPIAAQVGSKIEIKVIQGKDLEAAGFGGLWSVGKASEHLPALVVLSYLPPPSISSADSKSVCLVGKGITYDTGGLCIKTPMASMTGMKTDMGGSAAVLGAFATLVANDLYLLGQGSGGLMMTLPLHALLCISENSVGPLATRPDDVITLLSGKTVEVNNTDAEGRLVLADGCFFAFKELNAQVIIDAATLTGAQLIATGRNHAALYCNDEELLSDAVRAGKISGDLVFPLPYCPEFYRNEFRSQVADMKNSVADRQNAQSSCAGQFIGNHLEEYLSGGGKWLHIDMAGPAVSGERATGYGVALLSTLVGLLQP